MHGSSVPTPPYQQFPVLIDLCRARTVHGDLVTYCDRVAVRQEMCKWHLAMYKETPEAWSGWDVNLGVAAEYARARRVDRESLT